MGSSFFPPPPPYNMPVVHAIPPGVAQEATSHKYINVSVCVCEAMATICGPVVFFQDGNILRNGFSVKKPNHWRERGRVVVVVSPCCPPITTNHLTNKIRTIKSNITINQIK